LPHQYNIKAYYGELKNRGGDRITLSWIARRIMRAQIVDELLRIAGSCL
jgi:hypothetical protein